MKGWMIPVALRLAAAPVKTRVLMHRGAGNEPGFHQNTLEAVRYGSTVLDGAEFDLQLSAAGISFKYAPEGEPLTKAVVDGIHGVGYRIAVWTVNEPADIAAVWATGADVIQADNPDFYSYVPK